jgi:hypothetical protein
VALWLALFFRRSELVAAVALVLAASAVVGVRRAPLVALWRGTLHRLWPTEDVVLDGNAMRFAHALGAALTTICLVLLLTTPVAGRAMLAVVALAKTSGALGFCSALKLYGCVNANGGCCALVRRAQAGPAPAEGAPPNGAGCCR